MVIPRKANSADSRPAAVPAAQVLVELPYVGERARARNEMPYEEHAVASKNPPFPSSTPAQHPAFAELAAANVRAATGSPASSTGQQHYVDEPHAHVTGDRTTYPADDQLDSFSPAPDFLTRGRNLTWRARYARAHDSIAPFAGLIVTLALLSCAGLLFWLISNHQQPEFDLENLGFSSDGELSVDVIDTTPAEQEKIPATPLSGANELESSTDEKASMTALDGDTGNLAVAKEPPPPRGSSGRPESPSNQVPAEESWGELQYPRTATPLELDFSKAVESLEAETPQNEPPRQLPVVAERESVAEPSVSR